MGRKDKHKPGQSRNNAVFKIVGSKAGKTKGGAKSVGVKLKKLDKTKRRDAVDNLDAKFTALQKKNVSFSGTTKEVSKVAPIKLPEFNPSASAADVSRVVEGMGRAGFGSDKEKS